jgi:hypothetical protein
MTPWDAAGSNPTRASSPPSELVGVGPRGIQEILHRLGIADPVGHQQHKPRVERVAFRFAQPVMGLQKCCVDVVPAPGEALA